ncbi:DNA-directed DNA polymerase [Senna tora]|uniref:DNA-directed DNA polymerase n=1 Tax=Senna tora TaxID=362788 RepID=A0A834T424_9FABA|nr:DNA-directed DNA polymerase [Senna tora]
MIYCRQQAEAAIYYRRLAKVAIMVKTMKTMAVVVTVFPHRVVELQDVTNGSKFMANVQGIKHYWGGLVERIKSLVSYFEVI